MIKAGTLVTDKFGIIYKVVKVFHDGHFDIQHTEPILDFMPDFLPILYSEFVEDYKILNGDKKKRVNESVCTCRFSSLNVESKTWECTKCGKPTN